MAKLWLTLLVACGVAGKEYKEAKSKEELEELLEPLEMSPKGGAVVLVYNKTYEVMFNKVGNLSTIASLGTVMGDSFSSTPFPHFIRIEGTPAVMKEYAVEKLPTFLYFSINKLGKKEYEAWEPQPIWQGRNLTMVKEWILDQTTEGEEDGCGEPDMVAQRAADKKTAKGPKKTPGKDCFKERSSDGPQPKPATFVKPTVVKEGKEGILDPVIDLIATPQHEHLSAIQK